MVSIKMAQALAIHFSKDSNATRISKVYELFQGLGLNNGGRMEYLMAAAHAKEGKFYAAQLLLVLAIVEFKFTPHPKDLNALLELAVNDLPSGRSFTDVLNQYMDYKYPPSHVPRPSLNAKTFALKAQLCSTAQELTELIGRADQYCLLTSHLLQEAVIKQGVHLLKNDLPRNTHLLHGWLTRLHRPQRKFKATGLIPEYHEVSPKAKITCVYAFCQAKCAISATNVLTSLLKNHPTINPARKSKLFKAVLKTIVQHPHTHDLGWKNAILGWLTLHLQPQGEWNVDPSLRHLVFQALISLNEPEMANVFRESFASDSFPSDISSYISILEDGLASPTMTDPSSRT
ncbi:hypothetical protein DSO57_1006370 [Entomophthora muscae]|uniref:Uncharacterized protein n=1 Tax=Entomophthora muscae TaxID=34485 RepID=A0ACC2SWI6_9FUNG|nr:hypothetical protein DSO57_1006370 [Entomophthora muscae]